MNQQEAKKNQEEAKDAIDELVDAITEKNGVLLRIEEAAISADDCVLVCDSAIPAMDGEEARDALAELLDHVRSIRDMANEAQQ